MIIGSLFAGIGGLDLGLERAGLGPVVWQVERDKFCRSVLARHWPDADRFDDVRACSGVHAITCDLDDDCTCETPRLRPVDVICGGFPCQDVSDSEGVGLAGSRSGLWFEMLRIVRELRPRFVVVENSSALTTRGLDVVLGGLAGAGFDAVWTTLRAYDVGAPHQRARTFVVAHTDAPGSEPEQTARVHVRRPRRNHVDGRGPYPPGPADGEEAWTAYRKSGGGEPGIRRGVDGFPTGMDRARLGALGNAVAPEVAEAVGWIVRALAEAERYR